MTTAVQFLNGLDTIGGNVVSFTNGATQIIMDLGVNFAPAENKNDDLMASGVLPNVPALFTDEQGQFEQQVVFVSHLHLDHMGAFKYLTKPTDVYMSQESIDLYQTLVDLKVEPAANVKLHVILPEEPVTVGPFTITAFLSDHDAPGALMLRVSDGQHTFVHSGDVRLDGPHPERVEHWTQVLHAQKIDLFLLEGTEFSFEPDPQRARHTEASLQHDFQKTLQTVTGLVIINPYERNVERLVELQNTAKSAGRTLVWDQRFSRVLQALGAMQVNELERDVTWQKILAEPDKYVVQNHFEQLHSLDQVADGFTYLHMNGEPLGEYDPRFAELLAYLESRHVELQFMGASGHAAPDDLIRLAKAVNAQVTVPWHSFKPEGEASALRAAKLQTYLPTKNEILTFD
ncbi:MAG: MBL fold metallo-hydrolase [Lactobacillaceae bacterium]|jgi:ribonuclease J|nr:MBL fold metallo-hydrolase [Lactobacillaceae bacterium]